MKAQENMKNDDINSQAHALADLPVADEQAGETKGGNIYRNVNGTFTILSSTPV